MMLKTLPIFLLAVSGLYGQTSFTYFEDNYVKPDGGTLKDMARYGDDFLIAGKFFDNFYYNPAVIRVDTMGNHIWTTSEFDDMEYEDYDYYNQSMYDVLAGEDSGIYSLSVRRNPDEDEYERWCYRIDPADGHFLWKTLVTPYVYYFEYACRIYDYNDEWIAVTFFTNSEGLQRLQFLDRETGEIMVDHTFVHDGHSNTGNIAFDEAGDIYYSSNDTLYKIYKLDLDSIIWQSWIYNTDPALPDDDIYIDFISDIYFDEDGSLFVLGTMKESVNYGIISRIDPATGERIWFEDRAGSFYVDSYIDDGENIYVSWQHKYVGGGAYFYRISKFRKSDGFIEWYDSYDMEDYTLIDEDCSGGESAMALAFNDAGDLCMTGYHNGDNWDPGEWGNLTVTAGAGDFLYEKDIDLDISTCDAESGGYAVYNGAGNSMYYIGHIETEENEHAPLLVKTNETTGDIVEDHYLGGMHQFESYVIAIEHVDSGMAVLKQTGAILRLERYDHEKNLLWFEDITKDEYLFGNKLKAGPDGSLWVAAHSVAYLDEEPYYDSSTDTLYAYHFSADGTLLSRATKSVVGTNRFPIDMEIVQDTAFFVTNTNGNINVSRIVGNSFYGYTLVDVLGVTDFPYYFTTDYLHHANNQLMFFAYMTSGAGAQCTFINKSTMTATIVDTVPGIDYVRSIQQISDSIILLTGSTVLDFHLHGAVVAYNYLSETVVWSQVRDSSQFCEGLIDPDLNFAYAAGVSDEAYYISKYRLNDGMNAWNKTYIIVDDGKSDYENIDLAFDAYNNYIIAACSYDSVVAGPEDESKQALVRLIDTAGNTLKDIKVYPSHIGNYRFHTAASWNDGSFWAGGNNDLGGYRKAGFIMEFDTIIYPPVIIDTTITDSCYALFEYIIDGDYIVHFTNLSFGSDSSAIISYFWNFCDGGTSTEENPEHLYALPEFVCACLTITDTMGCADTYCVDDVIENISPASPHVAVYPNPVAGEMIHIYSSLPITVLGLYDITSRQLSFETNSNGNDTWLKPIGVSEGIYYLLIETGGVKSIHKVVLI